MNYEVSVWFERDRAHLHLSRNDKTICELWDEAVQAAIDDGFLVPPRHPRPTDQMWLEPMVQYARVMGYIK